MKYVVIFKAQIKQLDQHYFDTAHQLREKALTEYNCQKFEALSENGAEIALSYWNSLEDIRAWQQDAEHLVAQKTGKDKWYQSFSVEICEIKRTYTA